MSDRRRPLPAKRAKAPTLGDVRAAVAASADLSAVRVRDFVSAIACFGTLVGEEPEFIPLALTAIAARLGAVNPVAAGISPKRLANIRSDLLAAIAASGLTPASPARQELTKSWKALRGKLKTKRHRIGTSRLAQYASTAGLTPADIDDSVIATFITAIREQSLHRKPNDLHRQTAVIWNEVVDEFPELGLRPVDVPSFRALPGESIFRGCRTASGRTWRTISPGAKALIRSRPRPGRVPSPLPRSGSAAISCTRRSPPWWRAASSRRASSPSPIW